MSRNNFNWTGVFPAATTQFSADLALDLPNTQRVIDALIRNGVHGLILMGTVGEGNSLTADEKRRLLGAAREAVAERAPLIVGVSEFTTDLGINWARDAERLGADGLMVLPAMVYVPTAEELTAHFRAIAQATRLPIMLYNNPPAYRVEIGLSVLDALANEPTIVAIKESSPDTRRYTDIFNRFGDRYHMIAGLDDVVLEALMLGARGWVSGLTNVFPTESVALFEAARRGDYARALAIYRWFMPLLHLDAEHDLVHTIKLAEQLMGRGSERLRRPRLPLGSVRRAEVQSLVEQAVRTRPTL